MRKQLPELRPRAMTLDDVAEVAELHRLCFPESFLTQLGPSVLRCYCAQVVREPEGVASVLEDGDTGRIAGLAFATFRPGYRGRMVKRHPWLFFSRILWGLLTKREIRKGLRTRLRRDRMFGEQTDSGDESELPPVDGPEAWYFLVAVHPDYRRQGGARMLLKHMTDKLFSAGAIRIRTVVEAKNAPSLGLHRQAGFALKQTAFDQFTVWLDRSGHSAGA